MAPFGPRFLLESVEGGERLGRYSFIGFGEAVEFRLAGNRCSIDGDPSKPETVKVEANINVASLNTNNAKRDKHLKSPDFFDAAKYPMIRFASTGVKTQGSQLVVTGNLTMHGVSKLVSTPLKVAKGKNGAGVDTTTYKGKLTIDRNDYGIGTDSIAAKISLEDEVEVKLLVVTFQ